APEPDRVGVVRPQLVVARGPDDLGEPLAEHPQRPRDVGRELADVAGHQQPVVLRLRPQPLDDQPGDLVAHGQVTDSKELRLGHGITLNRSRACLPRPSLPGGQAKPDGKAGRGPMTAQTDQESFSFQAEVVQILDLMIHSLYINKEIFLRELISNASDAIDRLRFETFSHPELEAEESGPLQIRVGFDAGARTITVSDNGIGMSRAEVIDNIGTIAKSGTREFLSALTGDQRRDATLIGQFGVGFYSAFVVADRVTLTTRRAGLPAA